MNEGSDQLRARLGGHHKSSLMPLGVPFEGQSLPRMDIKFPILGFLMESQATGYDLKRRFVHPIGFFYRISDGSLYPALKKLARDGLVTVRAAAPRPPRAQGICDHG